MTRERSLSGGLVAASLAGLILVQGVFLALWLRRDTRPPTWDPSVHLMSALRYRDAVKEGHWGNLLQTKTSPGHPPYPPVVHDAMAMGIALSGSGEISHEDAAVFTQLFFLAILIVGSYLLASGFWGASAGLAAAALASFSPPVQALAHQALVDLGLIASVVFAYACWVRCEGFRQGRWSLALGVVIGTGCLTKWAFPTYLLPLFVSAAFRWTDKKQARNILLAAGVAVILAVPWYILNLPILIPKLSRVAHLGAQEGDPSGMTLAGWLWYGRSIWFGWSAPLVLGGLAGMVWGLFRRAKSVVVLAAWFLTSYALWSLVSNKDPRYLAPAAVILPIAFAALPFRLPAVGALAAGVWSLLAVFSAPGRLWMDSPLAAHWPLGEMVQKVEDLRRGGKTPLSVLTLVSNHDFLNGNNLTWTSQKMGVADRVAVRTKTEPLGQLTDFVLVKTGDLGPERSIARQRVAREEIFSEKGWFGRFFVEASRWALPDGSEAVLFQQRASVAGSLESAGPADGLRALWPGSTWTGFHSSLQKNPETPGESTTVVSADELRSEGISLRHLALSLEGLRWGRDDGGKIRLLRLRRLNVRSAQWTEEDARAFLAQKVPLIREGHVSFLDGNQVRVSGAWGPVPIQVEMSLSVAPSAGGTQRVGVDLRRVRIAGVSVPGFGRVPLFHHDIALAPTGRMPFEVRLGTLQTRPGRLDITSERP